MTRRSRQEYILAIRQRYRKGDKKAKARILDEFVAVTGVHRKSAIRMLGRKPKITSDRRQGRPKRYGAEVKAALKVAWEASDCICSKRLQPFLGELVRVLKAKGELKLSSGIEEQLKRISASTIDRMTLKWRYKRIDFGISTTKPGTHLKNAIAIKTFGEWADSKPGYLEADLVAHCGDRVDGFYLTTLSVVDVATGWFEPVVVWGKGQVRVRSAIDEVCHSFPMPVLGLDCDNGTEFINRGMYEYCLRKHIAFTRSRSYKKNDSCHVEQKNWSVVRRHVGYQRLSSQAAYEALGQVYMVLRLYLNFFQPVLKMKSKTRQGARVHKVYDIAQTPYMRLLKSDVLSESKKQELAHVYESLNPLALLRQLARTEQQLHEVGIREPSPLRRIDKDSVTLFMNYL